MTGEELKRKCLMKEKSQKSLADLLGITAQSLTSIFNASDVRSGTIEKLSGVLGVPVSYFYGNEGVKVSVGDGASMGDNAQLLTNNHQDHSSNGGAYNSPEIVQALIAQLAQKDEQLKRMDEQLARKDDQLARKDDQLTRKDAQLDALLRHQESLLSRP